MSTRKRILIVIISVSIGTLLAAWMMKSRKGHLASTDWSTLLFNTFFSLAIVIGVSIYLYRRKQ